MMIEFVYGVHWMTISELCRDFEVLDRFALREAIVGGLGLEPHS
jgi:hypothetical protein